MSQMTGLIAKFFEGRRSMGRKKSADPPSDAAESKSDIDPCRSNSKRARENIPSDDDLSVHS